MNECFWNCIVATIDELVLDIWFPETRLTVKRRCGVVGGSSFSRHFFFLFPVFVFWKT